MKYIDEFNNPVLAKNILRKIRKNSSRRMNIMEVCGTHTMAIFRHGLREMLPESINFLSGPGCPVCVTSQKDIDRMIALAGMKDVIVATFGDMLKVPGTLTSLEKERAGGADIRVVYGPAESLAIARENPGKKVVFIGIGFETTSPLIAACVLDAFKSKMKNYFVLTSHKLVVPAMQALMESEDVKIDGFLCPGHVSITIGADAYKPIPEKYGVPCVVSGFEPLDILQSIYMIINQIRSSESKVETQYKRVVCDKGNKVSQELLSRVFEEAGAEWRGLGNIPGSGLKLKKKYDSFNAEKQFNLKIGESRENPACSCGEILKGIKKPSDCRLFGKACTPENPYGPCMVSTEGTCAAYYKYGK